MEVLPTAGLEARLGVGRSKENAVIWRNISPSHARPPLNRPTYPGRAWAKQSREVLGFGWEHDGGGRYS